VASRISDVANKRLFGLVLAGGKSRRMGQDKALLDHLGKSQLAFSVDLLSEFVDKVYVSTRPDQTDESERRRYDQIVDRYDNLGPVAGILSALREHPDVDWLVVACDLPNIDAATIRYLLAESDDQQPFVAYASSVDGLPEPLCAIYRATCADIIQGFVDEGLYCPRKMLIRSHAHLLTQPNPRALDNVNTPDDLQKSSLRASR
jgi:molybdopterin-guanine dinucleotide biosynthesis protein A